MHLLLRPSHAWRSRSAASSSRVEKIFCIRKDYKRQRVLLLSKGDPVITRLDTWLLPEIAGMREKMIRDGEVRKDPVYACPVLNEERAGPPK